FLDLFSWEGGGRLYRNLKGKKFEHLAKAIPPLPQKVSLGAAWGDFDGDGLVDLYIGGYETWTVASYVDVIYRNQGDGTFKETWRSKGGPQPARGITAADYDEDGDLDVYVSNYRLVPNLLWKNDGKGKFTNVAAETGTAGDGGLGAWGHTIGSAWGDLDNDGHLDLFVGNFSHRPAYQDRPKFLKNLGPEGKFRFADKTATAGLRWQESYASPTLGDFDNDGRLDLFFTTVYPGNKSVLYRNAGGWKFTDATAAAKINTAKTYQAAWADFDGDGYLDLVSGGRLLRNPGGKNHWLKVRLVGKGKVNAAAIGAQVRIKLASGTLTRQISSATGQGNQNALVLHFGLGEHSGSVKLQIRWPDGSKQEVKTEIGQATTVVFDQSSEK
ncbi:MAG: CRTAC1 family protein, partial [Planctomycetes bacterium]|nr:CRTAC1 family protein [Planctomycetota bacterium]